MQHLLTMISYIIIPIPVPIILPIPHKQKRFTTSCLQSNSRFHLLSTFIVITTDFLHAKRAQNDEYAQT